MRAGPLASSIFSKRCCCSAGGCNYRIELGARVAAGAGAIAHANLVEVSNVGKELTDAVLGGPEPGNQRVFEGASDGGDLLDGFCEK